MNKLRPLKQELAKNPTASEFDADTSVQVRAPELAKKSKNPAGANC